MLVGVFLGRLLVCSFVGGCCSFCICWLVLLRFAMIVGVAVVGVACCCC